MASARAEWLIFSGRWWVVTLLQLAFETTIPEEILTVKTMSSQQKRQMARKKRSIEPDGDSDEEAQQLIDEAEAENEQENEAASAAGMS